MEAALIGSTFLLVWAWFGSFILSLVVLDEKGLSGGRYIVWFILAVLFGPLTLLATNSIRQRDVYNASIPVLSHEQQARRTRNNIIALAIIAAVLLYAYVNR